jgi:hypothetical protein
MYVDDLSNRLGIKGGDLLFRNGEWVDPQSKEELVEGDTYEVYLADPAELELIPPGKTGKRNIQVSFLTLHLGIDTTVTLPPPLMERLMFESLVDLFSAFYHGDDYFLFVDGQHILKGELGYILPGQRVDLVVVVRDNRRPSIEPDSEEEVDG